MATLESPLDKLTNEDFEQIVRETLRRQTVGAPAADLPAINVSNINVTERSNTSGYLGAYYKLVITIEPTRTMKDSSFVYFVKTLPLSNPELMKLLRDCGMDEREHKTYMSLLTKLDGVPKLDASSTASWHPHCYFHNQDLLVLEDLFDNGYEHVPIGQSFTPKHITSALRSLASMHASSVAYEKLVLKGLTIKEVHSDLLTETSFVDSYKWFHVGLEMVTDLVPLLPNFEQAYADRWCPTKFLRCLYHVLEYIKPSKEFRNALSHQDLWTSNILFRSDDSLHTKLIDFQTFRYLPPAMDILQMLALTTRRTERNENLNTFLKSYHNDFSNELRSYGLDVDEILPLSELLRSSTKLRLLPLVNAAFLVPWIRMPPNTVEDLKRDDYEGYVHMAYVRRVEFVVGLMESIPNYREIVEEAVNELAEFVFEQDEYCKE